MSLNSRYEDRITEITKRRPVPKLNERYKIINMISEDYYKETGGSQLPPKLINLFTNWVLYETLSDTSSNKVSQHEFAVLSTGQMERRMGKELAYAEELIDFLNVKYRKNMGGAYRKRNTEFKEK
ncbi:hypothetical protein vBCtySFA70_00069 [Clostridium phage vB_CtyS-FA70]|nr:hypothetical protein vBCtySFA70_00069 [Clostridium phage vB_CtyS-FA70]